MKAHVVITNVTLANGASVPIPWKAYGEHADALDAASRRSAQLDSILLPGVKKALAALGVTGYRMSIAEMDVHKAAVLIQG